jgi:hypothetical protein
MLHVTNGDAAVAVMRQARLRGEMLPWRDVLHDGPVPGGLPIEELSAVRARFIAQRYGLQTDEVLEDFRQRDARLARFHEHEEVVLWFEHDLYDQLQLLQLLDHFARVDLGELHLSLICVAEYLGSTSPARIAGLYPARAAVTRDQLRLGELAWSAFCAPDPSGWERLRDEDTAALPFLAGAILRQLEEFPSVRNGTSRTEDQILRAVSAGIAGPREIFAATQQEEERRFMGDLTFWNSLTDMARDDAPLLRIAPGRVSTLSHALTSAQAVTITPTGAEVLNNKMDWGEMRAIDKWLGGVHLRAGNVWRFDRGRRRLIIVDA